MMNQTKEIELLRSVEQQYIDCGDTEIVQAIEKAIESVKSNAEIIKVLEPCEYRQNCIEYVKNTMECVGYRDYIVEQLEKEPTNAIPIPENATNGDMIKAMFPNAETWVEYDSSGDVMRFDIAENSTLECFNLDWWNAPYKKEVEENGSLRNS